MRCFRVAAHVKEAHVWNISVVREVAGWMDGNNLSPNFSHSIEVKILIEETGLEFSDLVILYMPMKIINITLTIKKKSDLYRWL